MKYRQLGKSGLIVTDLCLGTMIFGEDTSRATPEGEAVKIIHRYLEAGGNFLDTANIYAQGRAEEIVGRALAGRNKNVVLATKVRFPMGSDPNESGLSRLHIQNSVEVSLRRLRVDTIDLLYLHGWDPVTPIQETMRTLDDLVRSGKIRYIGVSNFKAWQLMKALSISEINQYVRFIAAQYQYSLVVRDIEREFVDLCLSEGVGITPWGPLGGGFLSGKYNREVKPQTTEEGRIATSDRTVEEAWERRSTEQNWKIIDTIKTIMNNHAGASASQVALAWLLAKQAVSSVIIGVRTLAQLEDNLKASELKITAAEMDQLDDVSALTEAYPYRFIEFYTRRNLE